MNVPWPRPWSELSRVERVDLYTRQSLHVVLWFLCGIVVLSPDRVNTGSTTAALLGAVVVTALGSSVMSVVIGSYPARPRLPWRRLVALVVAGGSYLYVVGRLGTEDARTAAAIVVVANLAAALGGLPSTGVGVGLVAASGLVVGLAGGSAVSILTGVTVAATVVFSVRASLWLYGVVTELDAARHTLARLAVAEERLRFSRDVHDVLGRHLTTIAVRAELAATLAERGDERAAAGMLEVRAIAHDALTEVRELARGYRPTNVGHELEGARSLLRSAGIDVRLDVAVLPRAWHEAAGWVVRESVTNVLRHSSARLVRISFLEGELRVENDGSRVSPDGGNDAIDGSGLRGLRERLAPLGATVSTERHGGHWTVIAHLPGTGPISATSPGAAPSVQEPAR